MPCRPVITPSHPPIQSAVRAATHRQRTIRHPLRTPWAGVGTLPVHPTVHHRTTRRHRHRRITRRRSRRPHRITPRSRHHLVGLTSPAVDTGPSITVAGAIMDNPRCTTGLRRTTAPRSTGHHRDLHRLVCRGLHRRPGDRNGARVTRDLVLGQRVTLRRHHTADLLGREGHRRTLDRAQARVLPGPLVTATRRSRHSR